MQPVRFLIRSFLLFAVLSLIGTGCAEDFDEETDTSLHPLQRAGVAAKKNADYCDRASQKKVPDHKAMICHIPPGNPANSHTIIVGKPSVPAHLAHGDTLGPCGCDDGSKPGKGPKSNGSPGKYGDPDGDSGDPDGDSGDPGTGDPGTGDPGTGDPGTGDPGAEGVPGTATTSIPDGSNDGDSLTPVTPESTPGAGEYDGGGTNGEQCLLEDLCTLDSDCGSLAYCDMEIFCCTVVFN